MPRIEETDCISVLQTTQEVKQVFAIAGGQFGLEPMTVFGDHVFERRGSAVMKIGSALPYAAQRRRIECNVARLVR